MATPANLRAGLRGPPGPLNVGAALDVRVLRVDEARGLVDEAADARAHALDLGRREVGQVGVAALRLDDGVEVAAIGDVDPERPELRVHDLQVPRVQEGRHVGELHRFHVLADLRVLRDHEPRRRLEAHDARRARRHEIPGIPRRAHRPVRAPRAEREFDHVRFAERDHACFREFGGDRCRDRRFALLPVERTARGDAALD